MITLRRIVATTMAIAVSDAVVASALPTDSGIEDRITLTRTAPRTEVYVIHDGPYWTLAPTIEQVNTKKRRLGMAGRIFVRFPPATARHQGGSSGIEVGFVADSPWEPDEPFHVRHRPSELVAKLVIDGTPTTWVHHPILQKWAQRMGYALHGGIVEFYPTTAQDSAYKVETELHQPLLAVPTPDPSSGARTVGPDVPTDRAMQFGPLLVAKPQETVRESVNPTPVPVNGNAAFSTPSAQPADIGELIGDGRYEAVAQRIVANALTQADRQWVASAIARWETIGRAVRQIRIRAGQEPTPADQEPFAALAAACEHEYHLAFGEQVQEDLVFAAGRNRTPREERRSGVILALDRMLVRISRGDCDTAEALAELTSVLAQIDSLLSSPG